MNNAALILVLQVVLLVCGAGFLYQKNPAGCKHLISDFEQLVSSAISGSGTPTTTPPEVPTPSPTAPTAAAPHPAYPVVAPTPVPPTPAVPTAPAAPPAPAATWTPPAVLPAKPNWIWTTISGQVYTNVKVLSVDPNSVMIMYDGGGERVPLAFLPRDLQKLFNYPPGSVADTATPTPPASPGPAASSPVAPTEEAPPTGPPVIAKMLQGNLVRYANNSLQSVSDNVLTPVRYYALYYSAQWCPPCHAFTPKLVQFYNSFKPSHPDFDLIFVSDDSDSEHMQDYMSEMSMPWPAVAYDQLDHSNLAKKSGIQSYAGSGIPDLVLVDSTGKVLSDSFHGSEYVGPETVVSDIQSMVK